VITNVALLINPSADRGRGLRVGVAAAREFRRLGMPVDVLIGRSAAEKRKKKVRQKTENKKNKEINMKGEE
jgi:hypothetical protein